MHMEIYIRTVKLNLDIISDINYKVLTTYTADICEPLNVCDNG